MDRVTLTPEEVRAKRAALRRYRTQMHAMRSFLESFARSNEVFSRPARLGSCCQPSAVHAATSRPVRAIERMTGATERLHALDVFRGVTIAAMILVSTPGSWDFVYPWLEHAPWNGWTLADLVFPFLLFAMGAAVPFALGRRRGTPRGVRRHVLRRALVLFALGLLLNAIQTPPPLHLATFRIPGVLQRIALVYLAVSWITERLPTRAQILVATAALGGYWLVLAAAPLSAEANLGAVIDHHVFGRHMLLSVVGSRGTAEYPCRQSRRRSAASSRATG